MDDSVIACDENTEETKTVPTNFHEKTNLKNRKFLYFTGIFISYHCIIGSCYYLLLPAKI